MSDEVGVRALASRRIEDALLRADDVQTFLQDVVDPSGAHFAPGTSATLTLLLHGHLVTVASSDEAAWEADQAEYEHDGGPCVAAVHDHVETVVQDMETDPRWEPWRRSAMALGFRSAAATPVRTGEGEASLALNLYSREVGAFGEQQMQEARVLADETSRGLRLALKLADQARVNEQLQAALVSRSTIDQALGVIMGQNRCTRDEAFAVLRRASQHRNVKLRDVAVSVITNLTGHAPADPPPFQPPR